MLYKISCQYQIHGWYIFCIHIQSKHKHEQFIYKIKVFDDKVIEMVCYLNDYWLYCNFIHLVMPSFKLYALFDYRLDFKRFYRATIIVDVLIVYFFHNIFQNSLLCEYDFVFAFDYINKMIFLYDQKVSLLYKELMRPRDFMFVASKIVPNFC